jgi:hypothetical protein
MIMRRRRRRGSQHGFGGRDGRDGRFRQNRPTAGIGVLGRGMAGFGKTGLLCVFWAEMASGAGNVVFSRRFEVAHGNAT